MIGDPALMQARIELLEAHVENLIQRVLVLEEGHDWSFLVKCHDCSSAWPHDTVEAANDWAEQHATNPKEKGTTRFHTPYVLAVVKR